jgi:hypothetical protein
MSLSNPLSKTGLSERKVLGAIYTTRANGFYPLPFLTKRVVFSFFFYSSIYSKTCSVKELPASLLL